MAKEENLANLRDKLFVKDNQIIKNQSVSAEITVLVASEYKPEHEQKQKKLEVKIKQHNL